MELHDRILENVGHVQHLTLAHDFRMLVHHQPTDVSKKEASIGIVRIGIGLRELVMHSMVAHPVKQWILTGQREAQHQYNAKWSLCLVRPMAPQSMGTASDTESSKSAHQKACGENDDKRL